MVLQFMKNLFTMSLKLQEVDEPLQLDMSELCLSDDFSQGNNGKHKCYDLFLLQLHCFERPVMVGKSFTCIVGL